MFGRVLVPEAVLQEIQSPNSPPKVTSWLAERPEWLIVRGPSALGSDSELDKLGAGEREAILLACEQQSQALLLIDEEKGRRAASRRQIRMIGTLGILELAATRDLLDLPTAVERLTRTTFYIAPRLLQTFLERHSRRKKRIAIARPQAVDGLAGGTRRKRCALFQSHGQVFSRSR
jgi:predicted nucleic acid-binding protein